MKTSSCVPGFILIRSLLMLTSVFITQFAQAQVIYHSKLSPALSNAVKDGKTSITRIELVVTLKNGIFPIELFKSVYQTQKLFELANLSFYKIFATVSEVDSFLLPLHEIIFLEKGDRRA